jgi:hypothetical protein
MGREETSHDSVYKNLNAMGRKTMAFFLGLRRLHSRRAFFIIAAIAVPGGMIIGNYIKKENDYETGQSTIRGSGDTQAMV